MASGIDLGGDRPPNIVYLSGEANPLNLAPHDRRFWVAAPDMPVPAPANWPARPTDKPVLRNDLWEAFRNHARGTWTVAVYPHQGSTASLATQDYVVDDFGNLRELGAAAAQANTDWYVSTYCIDQAACEWMDQFATALPAGSALRSMATTAKAQRKHQAQPVRVEILDEPYYPFCHGSIVVGEDLRRDQALYSIHAAHDGDRLLLTHTQLCALALALLEIVRPAPEGSLQ